jgi:hypothetical protein
MASGHVYRANRPNTWLHRPTLQSADSSCQPGAVHTWPISEVTAPLIEVRLVGRSGLDLLTLSSSHFDPNPTSAGPCNRGITGSVRNNDGESLGPTRLNPALQGHVETLRLLAFLSGSFITEHSYVGA